MALDSMVTELVNETMLGLQNTKFTHDSQLRVSPRRMRAMHLFAQQRMQFNLGGKIITLIEDDNAPEYAEELAAAVKPPEDIAPPAPTAEELQAWRDWSKQNPAMAAALKAGKL